MEFSRKYRRDFYTRESKVLCADALKFDQPRYKVYIRTLCDKVFGSNPEFRQIFVHALGRGRVRNPPTLKTYQQRVDILQASQLWKDSTYTQRDALYKCFRAKEIRRRLQQKRNEEVRLNEAKELAVTHSIVLEQRFENLVHKKLTEYQTKNQYRKKKLFLHRETDIHCFQDFIQEFGWAQNPDEILLRRVDLSEHSTAVNRFTWTWRQP